MDCSQHHSVSVFRGSMGRTNHDCLHGVSTAGVGGFQHKEVVSNVEKWSAQCMTGCSVFSWHSALKRARTGFAPN